MPQPPNLGHGSRGADPPRPPKPSIVHSMPALQSLPAASFDTPAQLDPVRAAIARSESPPPMTAPRDSANAAARTATPAPASEPATVDIEALATNFARLVEEGGRAVAAYLKPREDGSQKIGYSDEVADAVKTLGQVWNYWYSDPQRAVEMQARLGKAYLDLYRQCLAPARGRAGRPGRRSRTRATSASMMRNGHRTNISIFSSKPICSPRDWAKHLVDDADQLDPATRQKAEFYMRQIVNAISPSNFLFTNPELLRGHHQ